MKTLGAPLERVEPGDVEIRVPFRKDLTQQHGFLHAGVVTAALDSAYGYAARNLNSTRFQGTAPLERRVVVETEPPYPWTGGPRP